MAWSWQSYPFTHVGFSESVALTPPAVATAAPQRGHDPSRSAGEARVLPRITGPLGPGNLQYIELCGRWRSGLTKKPVKFGTIMPELLAADGSTTNYYKDPVERVWAFSEAINRELNALADAGCPVIQMEEPQIHMVPARGKPFGQHRNSRTRQDLQQHGQGAGWQDRSMVPHLLG